MAFNCDAAASSKIAINAVFEVFAPFICNIADPAKLLDICLAKTNYGCWERRFSGYSI